MPYEEILERFKAQLKIMNLKVTRERLMILEEVMKRKDHFVFDRHQSDLFFS
jgi:Fe2+ or Zn2+ uptake regulation protein